ncbi:hypothetical protein [Nocardia salmonicida]|uniref:hypothetical protein n=1 Tax=Nocardia salmonicida TaxID=53431 RepID=UPI0033E9D6BD
MTNTAGSTTGSPPKGSPGSPQRLLDSIIIGGAVFVVTGMVATAIAIFVNATAAVVVAIVSAVVAIVVGFINLFFKDRLAAIALPPKIRMSLSIASLIGAITVAGGIVHVATRDSIKDESSVLYAVSSELFEKFDHPKAKDQNTQEYIYDVMLENRTGSSIDIVGFSLKFGGEVFDLTFHQAGICSNQPLKLSDGELRPFVVTTRISAEVSDRLGELRAIPSLIIRDSTGREWTTASKLPDWPTFNAMQKSFHRTFTECVLAHGQ